MSTFDELSHGFCTNIVTKIITNTRKLGRYVGIDDASLLLLLISEQHRSQHDLNVQSEEDLRLRLSPLVVKFPGGGFSNV